MKKISIGIPCYNEEENIELMYKAVTNEMRKLPQYDYNIIFADNCSTDRSREILRRIAGEDKKVRVIFNSKNFGPQKSSVHLFSRVDGDAYIGIPCDFQDPPEMIPTFIEEWEKGNQIVWGQKTESNENKIKYGLRKVYYAIIDAFSPEPQLKQCTGFGLMSREVIDAVLPISMQDVSVSWRYLVLGHGFDIKLIPYTQRARERGKSSYTASTYFDFAMNSLINTSVKTLRIVTLLGIFMSIFSFIVALVYLILKLIHWHEFDAGMAPVLIGVFFLGSIQLLCLGVIGEYIASVIRKITPSTFVTESECLNFDEEDDMKW